MDALREISSQGLDNKANTLGDPASKPSPCIEEPHKDISNENVDELTSQIGEVLLNISEKTSETELVQNDETITRESITFCDKKPDEKCLIVSPLHEVEDCIKIQGRLELLPVEKFEISQLPQRHRNEEMFKFITMYANLAVKIIVELTRSKNMKTGSGWIGNVTEMTDGKCLCNECQQSATAKTLWWVIDVFVGPDLVLDQSEADNATLILLYNRENRILKNLKVVEFSKKMGEDWLTCATHDKGLGTELFVLRKDFFSLWLSLSEKHMGSLDSERLAFMVVHPGESPKHIVFGQCVVNEKEGEGDHCFTCAIPGCRGAPGCIVGKSYFKPYIEKSKHMFYPAQSRYRIDS